MLNQFLQDAAAVYAAVGGAKATIVADKLRSIDVPGKWAIEGPVPNPGPNQQSLAIALGANDCLPGAQSLAPVANQLVWHNSTSLRSRPNEFQGDYNFTVIVGPGSLLEDEDIRFGVYLQDPHTIYPAHHHAAEELYIPLSGTALWQKDDGPFVPVTSGTPILHQSYQPHATTTDEKPMLAFWAWLGNLSIDTYAYVNP